MKTRYQDFEAKRQTGLEQKFKLKELRWELGKQVYGEGTFGKVIAVKDRLYKGEVAAKISKYLETSVKRDVERERRILYQVQEARHTVRILGSTYAQEPGSNAHNLLIFMKKVPENFYVSHIDKRKEIPFSELVLFLQQLLETYSDLVKLRIIHADLGFNNVSWKDQTLTVFDFGLSQEDGALLTNSGASLQTIDFRAPEVLLGKPYCHFIDLWSIGVMCFEAFSSEQFVAAKNDEVFKAVGQISDRIGEPPRSYLSQSHWDKDPKGFFEKLRVRSAWRMRNMLSSLRDAARRRRVPPEQYAPFEALLTRILAWENRPTPEEALRMCKAIIPTPCVHNKALRKGTVEIVYPRAAYTHSANVSEI